MSTEYVAQRTCGADGVTLRVLTLAGAQHVANLKRLMTVAAASMDWEADVRRNVRLTHVTEVKDLECPAVDVEVEVYFAPTGRTTGIERWECPVCGTEHEDEVDGDD